MFFNLKSIEDYYREVLAQRKILANIPRRSDAATSLVLHIDG